MISYGHECIFIHIPKTGGSSIESLIWPDRKSWDALEKAHHLYHGFINLEGNAYQTGAMQHLFASNVRKAVGKPIFDKFWKFTMVRNPWDKAVSQYRYMADSRPNLRKFIGMEKTDSFKKYLSLIQKRLHVQWEPQYKFFLDTNGECLADTIYRFEDFDESVRHILEVLNTRVFVTLNGLRKFEETVITKGLTRIESQGVPHVNKTKRTHYHDYYDDESKEIVDEIYAKDIKILGYQY